MCVCMCVCVLGLCDLDKKKLSRFLEFYLISILITILTQQTCFTVINAFCVNLKHISKGNQLDLSQKSCKHVSRNRHIAKYTHTHIHIYLYIYIYTYIYTIYIYIYNMYMWVINPTKQQQPWACERSGSILCFGVCALLRSLAHGQSKRSANVPLTLTVKIPNPLRSRAHTKCLRNVRPIYFFLFIVTFFNTCLN